MVSKILVSAVLSACCLSSAAAGVLAATPEAAKPTIAIMSPTNGTTVYGPTVSVAVRVANFKLVQPVYQNPPLLPGNQGHIHYVLDSLSNFVPTRDAASTLSHSWSKVQPGVHTLTAYLATSRHNQFPGTVQASVRVTVKAARSRPPTRPLVVRTMPASGGGAGRPPDRPWLPLALLATAAVLFALTLRVGLTLL